MRLPDRRLALLGGISIAVLAISIPALAASPSPSSQPAASAAPGASASPAAKPDKAAKPENAGKKDKGPETPISLTGTLVASTDADGRPSYSMVVAGKTWEVSAGPAWFWGNKNPLAPFVGKSVTVSGSTHTGDDEVEAEAVDGKVLREPGKPPWAGGPWVVGEIHPGWKDWMADGKPGKGHGRDDAPGQVKKESATP